PSRAPRARASPPTRRSSDLEAARARGRRGEDTPRAGPVAPDTRIDISNVGYDIEILCCCRSHQRFIQRVRASRLRLFRHDDGGRDRKSTRLNSSHVKTSYAV